MLMICGVTYIISCVCVIMVLLRVFFSDTGTVPPESCVFGQLLNIYAALSK